MATKDSELFESRAHLKSSCQSFREVQAGPRMPGTRAVVWSHAALAALNQALHRLLQTFARNIMDGTPQLETEDSSFRRQLV